MDGCRFGGKLLSNRGSRENVCSSDVLGERGSGMTGDAADLDRDTGLSHVNGYHACICSRDGLRSGLPALPTCRSAVINIED